MMNDTLRQAYELAKATREKAHAKYSHFKVGAVVKLHDSETLFAGCNVENSSYGGTLCAERTALSNSVAALGKQDVEFMVLVTDREHAAMPCGICRQFMSEFVDPIRPETDFPVHIANLQGIQKTMTVSDMLPHAFEL